MGRSTTHSTTIELFKEEMKFSAGHFTIFSATERENLHGHNFTVRVSLSGTLGPNGILTDYTPLKAELNEMCKAWNSIFILPTRSPHLKIDETPTHYIVHFADEELTFLKRDVLLLPIRNATLEEFADLMLAKLLDDREYLDKAQIDKLTVTVFSGPGQSASADWSSIS